MSNIQIKGGLRPLEYLDGNPWMGKGRVYCILAADANAYAPGDPVTVAGTSDANGIAVVTLATAAASKTLLGPIIGAGASLYGSAQVTPGQLESVVIPASKTKNYYVTVCDDPNVVYELEEGGAGAALTLSLGAAAGTCPLFMNYNLLAGANTGYVSGWTLNNATGTALATGQVQILGLVQRADVTTGVYAKWKVRINQHVWNGPVVGV